MRFVTIPTICFRVINGTCTVLLGTICHHGNCGTVGGRLIASYGAQICYIISKCYYLLMADKLQSGFHHKLLREWQSMNTRIDRSCLIYPIFIRYPSDVMLNCVFDLWLLEMSNVR